MDRTELARREHENMVEAIALLASNATGRLIRREGGVALIATGLPLELFNQILIEAPDAEPSAIADAVASARERRDNFIVSLRMGTDDRFIPVMSELGLVNDSGAPWMPGMALHPIPDTEPEMPEGFEIVRVRDAAGIANHIRAGIGGLGLPEWMWHEVMSEQMLAQPGVAVYTGYSDGAPVSTGWGIRTGRTIGVYTISTVPEARGRGYAAAMTRRIVADGAQHGCDVAILQASDMGFPIYERLGYRTVVEYMGYVDPASVA